MAELVLMDYIYFIGGAISIVVGLSTIIIASLLNAKDKLYVKHREKILAVIGFISMISYIALRIIWTIITK